MDYNNFNGFEDFFYNMFNYTGVYDEQGCNDIEGGFQDLNPQLFTLLGQIVGMVLSGNLPFNLQNAIGNWLQLVGQSIETYNAQQQYFQSGPGRFYDCKYKNVTNPFCNTSNTSNARGNEEDGKSRGSCSEIKELRKQIENLYLEIEKLKEEKNK